MFESIVHVELPTITLHPSMPLTVRTGEHIAINCSATGEQPIYINWHSEDNRPLPPYVRVVHNFLEFSRITPNDAGRYYCTATNRHGNVTKAAEVIVKNNEITDNRNPTQYGRVQEVIEGETVSLECHEETTPGARVSKKRLYKYNSIEFID